LREIVKIYDLSVNQLKRAAVIKDQIERLNKELSAIVAEPASSRTAPRTESKMGEPSTSQTRDVFSQTLLQSQEQDDEPGSHDKVIGQVKGLPGSKEMSQEVTCATSSLTAYFRAL